MTVRKVSGVVEFKDRSDDDGGDVPYLGEVDLIAYANAVDWNGKVTVGIADETFTADSLDGTHGYRGWSEWTPASPPRFVAGSHDLLDILDRYEGKAITVWFADEPFNILA